MPLQSQPQRPLNLLSLDGGTPEGVVTQITMIQEILSRRAYDEGKDVDSGDLRPCEYFDIIGGTGLGGVLGLLFGNRHMSCRDARETFEGLCNGAFIEPEDPAEGYLQWVKDAIVGGNKSGISQELLDLKNLRATMKEVFKDENPDPMRDDNECVAAVFVRSTFNLADTIAVPFRNGELLLPGFHGTVDEAACATVATPDVFGPVETAAGDSFISAGLGATNPTRELIRVAERVYKGDRRVGCIVNLGTGTRRAPSSRGEKGKRKGGDADSAAENVVRSIEEHMAVDAMRTSEDLKRKLTRANYFYLSVDSGLHDAKMTGWDLSVAEVHASSYTDKEDSNKLIDGCVGALSGENPGTTLAQLVQATALGVDAKPLLKIPQHFVPPTKDYNDMFQILIKRKEPILVITGRLGIGKSLLASYYGHTEHRRYKHIFLIDSSTEGDIRGDLQTAIRSIGGQYRHASWKEALAFFMMAGPENSWLLIFDGVGENVDLPQFIPHSQKGAGTVIINGRDRMLAVYAPNAHLSMEPRSMRDALEILKLTAQYEALIGDPYTYAVRLCKAVGCVPVVLVQAGTYCKRMSSSVEDSGQHFNFDDYRSMYEKGKQRWELLGEKAPAGMDSYNQYFMATFQAGMK